MKSRLHFRIKDQPPIPPGTFFQVNKTNFPALVGLAVQHLDMIPGAVRNAHIHPNAAQVDYCIAGRGRIGIVGPDGESHLFDVEPGDVSFVPQGWLHWIENTSDQQSRFLLVVSNEEPQTIELSTMISRAPEHVRTAASNNETADS